MIQRNELCCLDGRQAVAVSAPTWSMPESTQLTGDNTLLAWSRSALAALVVLVLMGLGIANIAMYSRWTDVEDGVYWDTRPEGVSAVEVAPGSPAAVAGVKRGDLLLAVNGVPVETQAEVVDALHRGHEGTRLAYTLVRLGTRQGLTVSLTLAPHGSSLYYVLAAVGLFTLLVGASVRLRRPR